MCPDKVIRRFAGAFVILSVVLSLTVDPRWMWFTAFVGANLFQSAFTGICPLVTILHKLGVKDEKPSCAR